MWFPDWQFPMKVGLAISSRWGTNIDFDYDGRAFIEAGDSTDTRYKQMPYEWQIANQKFGPYSFIEDPNGDFIKNPNYLHILEPSGEDVTPDDYKEEVKKEVKEEVKEVEDTDEEISFDNLF